MKFKLIGKAASKLEKAVRKNPAFAGLFFIPHRCGQSNCSQFFLNGFKIRRLPSRYWSKRWCFQRCKPYIDR